MDKPIIIGITGGTGSGKSTVARLIFESFGGESITILMQDSYYKDQTDLTPEERLRINYDHPSAFDTELLIEHLNKLRQWQPIDMPQYDFTQNNRRQATVRIEPKSIIILEGILIFDDPRLRELIDIKIYVDTDADIRIIRRLLRDIDSRGRTLQSVVDQYLNVVRPMHIQFVEPTKRYADIIIPEGGHNQVAIDIMVRSVKDLLVEPTSPVRD